MESLHEKLMKEDEEISVGRPYEKLIDDLSVLNAGDLKDLHKAAVLMKDFLPDFWKEIGLGNIDKQILQMYQRKMSR